MKTKVVRTILASNMFSHRSVQEGTCIWGLFDSGNFKLKIIMYKRLHWGKLRQIVNAGFCFVAE